MTDDIQYPDTPFSLERSLVLLGRRGSESHGTFIPSTDPNGIDDRDLMGICIPPKPWILGLRHWEGAEAIKGVWDVVLYDFRKFVSLLCKQNPNVLGMLWLESEDYLHRGYAGEVLCENRDLFRCRDAAYNSFAGYANAQLKKMSTGAYRGYMGDKRKALVAKHGYDVKNGAHLIRLLHMGEEFLETGKLRVRRTWDRDLLVDIKRGGWTLTRVQEYAEERFRNLRRRLASSPLPEEIDMDAVNDLVVRCVERHLRFEDAPSSPDIERS